MLAEFWTIVPQLKEEWVTGPGPHGVDACVERRAFTCFDCVLPARRVCWQWGVGAGDCAIKANGGSCSLIASRKLRTGEVGADGEAGKDREEQAHGGAELQ